jgi:hypothetical protein
MHYGNRTLLVLSKPTTDRYPAPHPSEPFLLDSFNISLPLVLTHNYPSGLPTKDLQAFLPLCATNTAHLIRVHSYHHNIRPDCVWWSFLLRNFLHHSVTSCMLRTIILRTLQLKTLRKCSSLTACTKTHTHTRCRTDILQLCACSIAILLGNKLEDNGPKNVCLIAFWALNVAVYQ